MDDERYLLRAIDLAAKARSKGNEPFGALIVDPDGNVLVEVENTVVTARDWTAHAETNAVREACAPVRKGHYGPASCAYSSPAARFGTRVA
jgi:tRNA(Arg) A34 adenosine deaminase TadA